MAEAGSAPPVIFGEVLFDRFPDGNRVLGGAPFNVAWHLQAFGAAPLFVSRVGADEAGEEIRRRMTTWGMSTRGLQEDPVRPTGAVTIRYEHGQPLFDILADQAYDHIDADVLPPVTPRLLYHGSLAVRHSVSRDALGRLRASGAPVFVDINLRDPWWDRDVALAMLGAARWAKLNEDELTRLAGRAGTAESNARELLERLSLELLIVTLGASGAMAVTRDDVIRVAPERDVQVVDPVGAGDAFASVLLLAVLEDWPLHDALARAQAFASRIVGRQGATVDDPAFYAGFVDAWGPV